jgi:hypothetical protein
MKTHIYSFVLITGLLLQLFLGNILCAQIHLVNDTFDIAPCIPLTVNFLANDIIPAGDSILLNPPPSVGYITTTGHSGNNYTFVANADDKSWGQFSSCELRYSVVDYTLDTTVRAYIVFRIHDHSFDSLYLNNVNARFNANGSHFNGSGELDYGGFEVPKFSGKHTIFTSSLWIGGVDQNSNLHLAAERYGQGPGPYYQLPMTQYDFWAGPIMDSSAYSMSQDAHWNYLWNLKKSDIEYHKAHWNDAGYQPIHDILTWPGNGNTSLGQAAQLAPYFDRNRDGIYNPIDGDYPLIKGDQSLFFIFNDDRYNHTETLGAKMKIEIQGMAYVFDIPSDTALKNTVFLSYKVINRSANTYYNTYIGVFTDIDIGYANDDYIGCDVGRGYYYGYNGTPVDGTGQSYAYGANPPAQSVTFLGGPFMDPDGIDNPKTDGHGHQLCNSSVNGLNFGDGIVDNERLGLTNFIYFNNAGVPNYMLDPDVASQYYNYLQSIWRDSTKLLYGGYGHTGEGGYGPTCNFMFPGLTDTLNWGVGCVPPNGPENWSETILGFPFGDRRGLGSSGPFTFNPGQVEDFDLAFTFARDYTGSHNGGSVGKLAEETDSIRKIFLTNILPNGGSFNGITNKQGISLDFVQVFPNPASTKVYLRFNNNVNAADIRIYNANGILIRSEQFSPDGKLISLDVSDLSSGLYLITVEAQGQIVTKKVSIVK